MKKVLSMLLALAMVLTMAAFPAFAEGDPKISPVGATSPFSPLTSQSCTVGAVIDNKDSTTQGEYFRASTTITSTGVKGNDANFNVTIDLGFPYNVTQFYSSWGSKYATAIALWGTNDLEGEWTELADFTAIAAQSSTQTVSHTDEYRYIKVEAYSTQDNNPACLEVAFYGTTTYKLFPTVIKFSAVNVADGCGPEKMVDGDTTTMYSVNAWLSGDDGAGGTSNAYPANWSSANNTVILDLGDLYDVDALNIYWGKHPSGGWGKGIADSYNVYVSADNETYSLVKSYAGLAELVQGAEDTYSNENTTVSIKTPSWTTSVADRYVYSYGTVFEKALGWEQIRYIKIETTKTICNPSISEIEVFKAVPTGEKVPATYTVRYESDDPNFVAPADKVVEGKYVGNRVIETAVAVDGYVCDEPTKSITLVDGTNEIVFVYRVKTAVPYTVKYVDALGNPLADNKTVDTFEEGQTASEVALAISGYFCTDMQRTKSITIDKDAANNVITFTYKKVLIPAGAVRNQMPGTSNSGNDLTRLSDGNMSAYTQYTVPANCDFSVRPAEYIYSFSSLTNFEKVTVYTNANRAKTVKIYTTIDGETWDLVYTSAYENSARADETSFTLLTEKGVSTTAYVREFTLPAGTAGTQLKYEVVDTNVDAVNATWCGIYEIIVEGSEKESLVLDNASVIEAPNFGWATSTMDGTDATLFDGEAATNTKGYFAHSYWNESIDTDDDGEADTFVGVRSANPKNYYFIVDLGALYDIDTLALQGGAPDWNFTAPMGYNVYFAGVDGKFSTTPDHTVMKHAADAGESLTAATKVRTDVLTGEADSIRYIKIEVTAVARRPVVGEITLYGTKVDPAANPEKAGASNGAQIRLPSGTVPAGIRFGATIAKDVFGDVLSTGDYNYSELAAAGIKVGMFILPADLLGGNATLADYIMNDGEDALEVPAERVYAEDDFAVTFTAVLTNIPDTAYTRAVVAVPYVYIDGQYTFYAEMTRTYAAVAESVAAAYEAGEIELTAEQITLIEAVINRTLVAPEVA